MMEYRRRIYQTYASGFQDSKQVFNTDEAVRWGLAYEYYFRNWLPSDKGSSIVDLACGNGKLLHFFKQHNYNNIRGVDISPEQVQLSRQVCADVVEASVLDFLESATSNYDLITGLDIIEHFHKDEVMRFLDGCCAVLKKGGRLIMQTPNAESPWSMTNRYGDFTHEVGFNPNALSRLMTLCGFNSIEIRELGPISWGYSLKSSLRYVAWRVIRGGLMTWNVVETGDAGSGVFTRNFLITGCKI